MSGATAWNPADPILALAPEIGPREEWLDNWPARCLAEYRRQPCYILRTYTDGRRVAEDLAHAFVIEWRWHYLWRRALYRASSPEADVEAGFMSYATLASGLMHSSFREQPSLAVRHG